MNLLNLDSNKKRKINELEESKFKLKLEIKFHNIKKNINWMQNQNPKILNWH